MLGLLKCAVEKLNCVQQYEAMVVPKIQHSEFSLFVQTVVLELTQVCEGSRKMISKYLIFCPYILDLAWVYCGSLQKYPESIDGSVLPADRRTLSLHKTANEGWAT